MKRIYWMTVLGIFVAVGLSAESAVAGNSNARDDSCVRSGCSGQLCISRSEAKDGGNTSCEYKPEYSCLASSKCGRFGPRDARGRKTCDWQKTPSYLRCLQAVTAARAECPRPEPKSTACDTLPRPDWLVKLITSLESQPVAKPPASITCYYEDGKTFYYVPSSCCDQFNPVYDATGNIICSPDGGITGNGDGQCPDYVKNRSNGTLIWSDPRR